MMIINIFCIWAVHSNNTRNHTKDTLLLHIIAAINRVQCSFFSEGKNLHFKFVHSDCNFFGWITSVRVYNNNNRQNDTFLRKAGDCFISVIIIIAFSNEKSPSLKFYAIFHISNLWIYLLGSTLSHAPGVFIRKMILLNIFHR